MTRRIVMVVVILAITGNLGLQLIYGLMHLFGSGSTQPNGYVSSVVNAALHLEAALGGTNLNEYDAQIISEMHLAQYNPDPHAHLSISRAENLEQYWADECGTASAAACDLARSGNLQCVYFVTGAFALAGYPLPLHPDADNFLSSYAQAPYNKDWQEISADPRTPAVQRGLPQPADIAVWSDGLYNSQKKQWTGFQNGVWSGGVGHVGVVVSVDPAGKWLVVAESNTLGGGNLGMDAPLSAFAPVAGDTVLTHSLNYKLYRMPINADGTISTWEGYSLLGFIRNKQAALTALPFFGLNASKNLVRIDQSAVNQYDSQATRDSWWSSTCSAAAIAEVLNAYRPRGLQTYRLQDVLSYEIAIGGISKQSGLLGNDYITKVMQHFGFTTVSGTDMSLDDIIQVANAGTPVIASWPPDRYSGGHIVVVTGGDAQSVLLADSSLYNRIRMNRAAFMQYWGGFYAISTPPSYQQTAVQDTTTVIPLQVMTGLPTDSQSRAFEQEAWNDAQDAGINPTYFVRQINQESSFNPNPPVHMTAAGPVVGIAQFLVSTAQARGVNPNDPESSLAGAAALDKENYQLFFDPSAQNAAFIAYEKTFAAYNDGLQNVKNDIAAHGSDWINALPCETKGYIHIILNEPALPTCSNP